MAGRLSRASSFLFWRVGRCMLRPIFAHSHGRASSLTADVADALRWFLDILEKGLAEERAWGCKESRAPVLIWTDARSTPPRLAAVCVDAESGRVWWTDWAPPASLLRQLPESGDGHIATLEIMAVALAFSTWEPWLAGKAVRVFSDDTVAQFTLQRGSAANRAHATIIHSFWSMALRGAMRAVIDRVPTYENCSDDPSRECYALMEHMGAHWTQPWLHDDFWHIRRA